MFGPVHVRLDQFISTCSSHCSLTYCPTKQPVVVWTGLTCAEALRYLYFIFEQPINRRGSCCHGDRVLKNCVCVFRRESERLFSSCLFCSCVCPLLCCPSLHLLSSFLSVNSPVLSCLLSYFLPSPPLSPLVFPFFSSLVSSHVSFILFPRLLFSSPLTSPPLLSPFLSPLSSPPVI